MGREGLTDVFFKYLLEYLVILEKLYNGIMQF